MNYTVVFRDPVRKTAAHAINETVIGQTLRNGHGLASFDGTGPLWSRNLKLQAWKKAIVVCLYLFD